jgi:lipopolysaccharide/colanic/teichoic acid biosynthesis glycosyltransferase
MPLRPTLWQRLIALLFLSDLIAVSTGLLLARQARYSLTSLLDILSDFPSVPWSFLLVLGALWLLGLAVFGLYQRDFCVAGMEEYRRTFIASFATVIAAIAVAYATVLPLSRAFLILAWGLTTLALCIGRFCVRRFVYRLAREGHRIDRVLIVGAGKQGLATAVRLADSPSASTLVCGFLDEYRAVGQRIGERFPVLGEPLDLWRVAKAHAVTKAILVQSAMTWESLQSIIPRMHRRDGMEILLAPGMQDLNVTQLDLRQLGPILLAAPRAERIDGIDAALKRFLDLGIAACVLLLSAPVIIAASIWLRLRNGRWPIRRTLVSGRGGRPFALHEISGSDWLRRAHMARFPSLIAVITGQLSIVGPRPLAADQLNGYSRWAELLMSVRPGFIGPWWEGLPRHTDEEVQLDVTYLLNYSPLSDLQILWHSLLGLAHRPVASAGPILRQVPAPGTQEPVHG